jgi:hypothetical protein
MCLKRCNTGRFLFSLKTHRQILTHEYTLFSVRCTVFIMFSGLKIFFFFFKYWAMLKPQRCHYANGTLSSPLSIALQCPLHQPIFFLSAHLALFPDDGFLRWVAEGYFCVGSLLKLKSIEAPTLPWPILRISAKQNYVWSLLMMFPT